MPVTARRLVKILHLMALVAVVAAGIWVATRVVLVIDAVAHGPYCTWYNNECSRLSVQAGLVGRPESAIESVLGPPSSVWEYDQPDGRTRTYNYAPSLAASGKFQVHCLGGVVARLEPFDD